MVLIHPPSTTSNLAFHPLYHNYLILLGPIFSILLTSGSLPCHLQHHGHSPSFTKLGKEKLMCPPNTTSKTSYLTTYWAWFKNSIGRSSTTGQLSITLTFNCLQWAWYPNEYDGHAPFWITPSPVLTCPPYHYLLSIPCN